MSNLPFLPLESLLAQVEILSLIDSRKSPYSTDMVQTSEKGGEDSVEKLLSSTQQRTAIREGKGSLRVWNLELGKRVGNR